MSCAALRGAFVQGATVSNNPPTHRRCSCSLFARLPEQGRAGRQVLLDRGRSNEACGRRCASGRRQAACAEVSRDRHVLAFRELAPGRRAGLTTDPEKHADTARAAGPMGLSTSGPV